MTIKFTKAQETKCLGINWSDIADKTLKDIERRGRLCDLSPKLGSIDEMEDCEQKRSSPNSVVCKEAKDMWQALEQLREKSRLLDKKIKTM